MAAPAVTHPEWLPQAQRRCDALDSARAHRRRLPHLLGQTRRLYQAGHRAIGRLNIGAHRMPYTAERPQQPDIDELRARIPGWGVDRDPADRPAVPKMKYDPESTGAHWHFPERQQQDSARERSI